MENIIIIVTLALVVSLASLYVYRSKKKGNACIGCPAAKSCASKSCNCSCGHVSDKK